MPINSMNDKRYAKPWNIVYLDGDVPDEKLRQMIGSGYDLIKQNWRKK